MFIPSWIIILTVLVLAGLGGLILFGLSMFYKLFSAFWQR